MSSLPGGKVEYMLIAFQCCFSSSGPPICDTGWWHYCGGMFQVCYIDSTIGLSANTWSVQPFADADDENILPDRIMPSTKLEPSTMAIPLHILALRKIASEIGSRVHSVKKSEPANQQVKGQILQSLHKRLIEWRRTMPFPLPDLQSKVPHLCTSWFDFNYYTHVIMLYRPSPLCQTLDLSQLRVLAEASSMAIRQAITMHRQQRFSYNWLNLAVLFNATLSLMYSTTAQPSNLSQVLESTKAIEDLELSIELLQAFSSKFASAKRIQGMVEIVLTKLKMQAVHLAS